VNPCDLSKVAAESEVRTFTERECFEVRLWQCLGGSAASFPINIHIVGDYSATTIFDVSSPEFGMTSMIVTNVLALEARGVSTVPPWRVFVLWLPLGVQARSAFRAFGIAVMSSEISDLRTGPPYPPFYLVSLARVEERTDSATCNSA
jgi:hypothetical protein